MDQIRLGQGLVVLLYGSRIILHRQVTSELFLIIGWSMLEVASINRAIAWERVSIDRGIVFLIIVAVAAVLSLYFYLQYYKIKNTKRDTIGI